MQKWFNIYQPTTVIHNINKLKENEGQGVLVERGGKSCFFSTRVLGTTGSITAPSVPHCVIVFSPWSNDAAYYTLCKQGNSGDEWARTQVHTEWAARAGYRCLPYCLVLWLSRALCFARELGIYMMFKAAYINPSSRHRQRIHSERSVYFPFC